MDASNFATGIVLLQKVLWEPQKKEIVSYAFEYLIKNLELYNRVKI